MLLDGAREHHHLPPASERREDRSQARSRHIPALVWEGSTVTRSSQCFQQTMPPVPAPAVSHRHELVPPFSGHRAERPAGAAPATAPPGLCPVGGFHDPFSVKFFAGRKVFQRNPCECLKGGEMTAEAERQGCLLSSEKRRSMSWWEGEARRKVTRYLKTSSSIKGPRLPNSL